MNRSRLARYAALWIAGSVGQVLLVAAVWSALDSVQSELTVAPTDLTLTVAGVLSDLHALFSWPFRLLLSSDVANPVLVGAAVIHFTLWGAAWLVFGCFVRRLCTRKAHEG